MERNVRIWNLLCETLSIPVIPWIQAGVKVDRSEVDFPFSLLETKGVS